MKIYVVTEYHMNEGGHIVDVYAREMDARHQVEKLDAKAKADHRAYVEFEYEEYDLIEAVA